MIKKFGICFVVISLVACIFCGAVFANAEVADGGGSGDSSVGYFPSYADLVTLWNTSASTNKITKDDIKYLICIKDTSMNRYYVMGSNKPFIGFTGNPSFKDIGHVAVDKSLSTNCFRFWFKSDWSYLTCTFEPYHSFYLTDINNIYGNHQYSYSFDNGTSGFFFNPQWSLETITRTPLKNLTRDFGKDYLTVSKVGLIILASLLGIILIKRWGNSLT